MGAAERTDQQQAESCRPAERHGGIPYCLRDRLGVSLGKDHGCGSREQPHQDSHQYAVVSRLHGSTLVALRRAIQGSSVRRMRDEEADSL